MNDTAEEQFTKYADQMLLNIADELNIKEVRLAIQGFDHAVDVVYHYDTISSDSKGFTVERDKQTVTAPDTLLIALMSFFSGNVTDDMNKVRDIVNKGLKQRADAGIKVRQPLQSITIPVRLSDSKETHGDSNTSGEA